MFPDCVEAWASFAVPFALQLFNLSGAEGLKSLQRALKDPKRHTLPATLSQAATGKFASAPRHVEAG